MSHADFGEEKRPRPDARDDLKNKLIEAADELYLAVRDNVPSDIWRDPHCRPQSALREYASASNAYRASLRPAPGQRWQHIASGRVSDVIYIARDPDMNEVVVYRLDGQTLVRPLSEFCEYRGYRRLA